MVVGLTCCCIQADALLRLCLVHHTPPIADRHDIAYTYDRPERNSETQGLHFARLDQAICWWGAAAVLPAGDTAIPTAVWSHKRRQGCMLEDKVFEL